MQNKVTDKKTYVDIVKYSRASTDCFTVRDSTHSTDCSDQRIQIQLEIVEIVCIVQIIHRAAIAKILWIIKIVKIKQIIQIVYYSLYNLQHHSTDRGSICRRQGSCYRLRSTSPKISQTANHSGNAYGWPTNKNAVQGSCEGSRSGVLKLRSTRWWQFAVRIDTDEGTSFFHAVDLCRQSMVLVNWHVSWLS